MNKFTLGVIIAGVTAIVSVTTTIIITKALKSHKVNQFDYAEKLIIKLSDLLNQIKDLDNDKNNHQKQE